MGHVHALGHVLQRCPVQEVCDGVAHGWSSTGAASPQGVQLVMEEIRAELKLEAAPDPARAFDFSFVQK